MNTRHFTHYKSTEILTADPAKIILMLYDGAITYMHQAADAAESRNYLERANKITRANNILLELLSSLNFEKGGEIATNLREIYVFLVKELLKADRENNAQLIRTCSDILNTIRDGWQTLVQPGNSVEMAESQPTFSNIA